MDDEESAAMFAFVFSAFVIGGCIGYAIARFGG
jgi:hypothetical protein